MNQPLRVVCGTAAAVALLAVCLTMVDLQGADPAADRQARKAARAAARDGARPTRLPAAVMEKPRRPPFEVAPVARASRPAVAAAAERIDELLAEHWREHGVRPSPKLTAEQFVRRAYLELAGRIPTHDEAVTFLSARGAAKRAELVDRLLESPDYVSHFYNWWADILRLAERPQKQFPFEPYLFSVKEAIRTNKPYDEWVHELLTADGRIWENPAVGFQLRDQGMPLPYVDNTVRVLLGTQIGCAQCHDHPFDHWTQREFYELAALTSGTRTRLGGTGMKTPKGREAVSPHVRQLLGEVRATNATNAAAIAQFVLANATSVSYRDELLRLPADYQYDDAEPLATVEPKVLWGEVPSSARAAGGREKFAAWIVSRDNRQFARTIANRLWKKLMGVGLVEPVDDFREENPASHPALLEHLTDEMVRLDCDLREFVRILVTTDAWQRRAVLHDPSAGEPFRFTGPALRRMTAEQLWDSLLVLIAHDPWSVQRPTASDIAAAASLDIERADLAAVIAKQQEFMARYQPGRYQRSLAAVCGYNGQLLVRASEQPAPLPLAHFMRQFGQSDRETIEGARQVATVPQILAMFNGPITHAMLEKGSVIYDEVSSHGPEQAIDVVFLSVLTHRPSIDDRRFAVQEVLTAEDRAAGFGNVIWALLNTREFIFIQ